jgi:hypothetical protein
MDKNHEYVIVRLLVTYKEMSGEPDGTGRQT